MRPMKDSGVEWIGEIPQGWNTIRFKYLHEGLNTGETIDKEYWTEDSHDRVFYTAGLEPIRTNYGDFPQWKYTEKNDLLLARNGTPYVYYPEIGACYTDHIIRASLKEGINKRYVQYSLQQSISSVTVETVSIATWSASLWNKQVIAWPSETEQQRIADYLDAKCVKIDVMIAKQQEIIEKLKAYKLSVITEAVTKGLNPNVPMKDSGVDFMGKIPDHWEMVRLKFLLSHIIDCPHETPEYSSDGDYLVIRTADQDFGFLRPDENMYRLNENEYQNRIRRLPLDKDDIVYGREGERWGLACLVPESNRYCLGQRMMQFRCNTDMILPAYAMWALNSRYVYLQGSVDTIGSTSPHVNISTMRNYNIPTPPLDEQQEIVRYIDEKAAAIEKTIQKRTMLIDKMAAYKKSLIYEVVTGKREVI